MSVCAAASTEGNATYNNATEYYLLHKQNKSSKSQKRIYLNIPYNEKEEAKTRRQMGIIKKSWYLENNKHKELMMGRW